MENRREMTGGMLMVDGELSNMVSVNLKEVVFISVCLS